MWAKSRRERFWWEFDHWCRPSFCTLLPISKPLQENESLTYRARCRRNWSHWPDSIPPSPSWLAWIESWLLIRVLERENFWVERKSVWITFDPGSDALQRPSPAKRLSSHELIKQTEFWFWSERKWRESTLSRAYRSPGLPPEAGWVVGAQVKRSWTIWGGSESRA